MWLRPTSSLEIARRLAAGRTAGAPDSPIAVRLPNGKTGNIASRSSVGYLGGEDAKLREKIIAVLWEDGFCDYLFMLLLLSLRCVDFALAVARQSRKRTV